MNLHVVVVGTSVLSNNGWTRGRPLPDKTDLQRAVAQSPATASAELNALLHYVEAGRCDRVHLIATDTPEGRLCRDVVGRWLASRNIATEPGAQTDMLAADNGDPYAAAAHLRDRVFSVACNAHRRGDAVYLNLTGGLKSETAVAAVTATLLSLAGIAVTAYYMHESMTQPVELPILSLQSSVLDRLRRGFGSQDWLRMHGPLDDDLLIAERERLITVQTNAEGDPSSASLTGYGRFILDHFARERQ